MSRIALSCCVLWLSVAAFAQNPHPSGADASEGQRLFVANCSACHGADAKGARGPDLTSGKWKHGSAAAEIARNIHDGIAGTEMPAVPLPGNQPAMIAEWLLAVTRGSDEKATGNAEAGRELFFSSAGCSGCHAMKGAGRSFGPDLSSIGEQRSVRDLSRAITAPGDNPRGGN